MAARANLGNAWFESKFGILRPLQSSYPASSPSLSCPFLALLYRWHVVTAGYGATVFAGVQAAGARLAAELESLIQAHGATRLSIVAASFGGLYSRWALHHLFNADSGRLPCHPVQLCLFLTLVWFHFVNAKEGG